MTSCAGLGALAVVGRRWVVARSGRTPDVGCGPLAVDYLEGGWQGRNWRSRVAVAGSRRTQSFLAVATNVGSQRAQLACHRQQHSGGPLQMQNDGARTVDWGAGDGGGRRGGDGQGRSSIAHGLGLRGGHGRTIGDMFLASPSSKIYLPMSDFNAPFTPPPAFHRFH